MGVGRGVGNRYIVDKVILNGLIKSVIALFVCLMSIVQTLIQKSTGMVPPFFDLKLEIYSI